jgi:putative endopeptidase
MKKESPSSGFVVSELSTKVRPQDDLFRHVNESWMERTPIPADRSSYGTFDILHENSERAIRDILEEGQSADADEARKFGDLYSSFLDEDRVEALGASPLQPLLEDVAAVTSISQLLETLGELQHAGISGLYEVFVDSDPGNPERYVAFFEQSGISLPDESYYREDHFADVRGAYVEHVQKMFELAGLDEGEARASRVMELETQIARRHWDNVATREMEKTYNLVSWADAKALLASGLAATVDTSADLDVWSKGFAAPDDAFNEIVVREPSFVRDVAELLDVEQLDSWKDWLAWRVVRAYAPYLSKALTEELFNFYGRTLSGAMEQRERWKRGVSFVEGAMGEAVGKVYVEHHFPPTAKQQMDVLVANLVEAYRQSISNLEWMSPATREKALEKLDAFTPKIGYPDTWRDYSTLDVDPTDLVGNVQASNDFDFNRELKKIGSPIDRGEWFMTPQTINAYYNPGFNEIVFPAAILQPPFFDPARDDAANYGAIGAVIGHEIGHGFDDQGSKFDGTGRLTDWWQASDREAFEKRTRSLIDQYNELVPSQTPGQHINGAHTIGENIGDLGGLAIAWKAYLISLDGENPPVVDGLSGAERFFMAWAQAWQEQIRTEALERQLATDPHSPAEFRCNQIVRNIDEFYKTFDVDKDDALWLDPDKRVTIW